MPQHCVRSSICRYSDSLKGSFRYTQRSFSTHVLYTSFSRSHPSQARACRKHRTVHHSAVQQTQTSALDPLDLNYNNVLNNVSLAATGNLAQEIVLGNDDEGETPPFVPGTFVEIRRNEKAVQGIVLGEAYESQKIFVYSLSAQGLIFPHYRADVHFSIPNLVSASLAERCGFGDATPENTVARVEALKRLQNLVSKVDKQAAGMEQRPLNVYIEVMDPDPTKWTTTTVEHVTRILYDRPTFMDYYMVHRYLIDQPLLYLANATYFQTQQFYVRPRRDIEEIQKVTEYIHRWRDGRKSPFPQFVRKAQGVIEHQKKRRESGPISQEKIDVTWNDEEQIMLNFLLRSLQSHRSNQSDPYATGRTELVKAILQPTTEVNDNLTFELVVQLGIIAPWQDLHELDPVLNPWGDFTRKRTIESEATRILQSSLSQPKAGSVVGPMDFLPSDPLESVRHDFGDVPVYVIDDPSAEELDDGISLERIPNEPENYWVHVHVADPTSLIHPNHVLAKMARRQGSTYYLSQRSIPLLPKGLVHHPIFGLSLGEQSKNNLPTRVMTFSFKLDSNANILDYNARAGLVRNVRKTSYQQVDLALDLPAPTIRYPLGGAADRVSRPTFNQTEVQDLQILMKLANDQVSKRIREGVWQYGGFGSRIKWKNRIPPHIRSPSSDSNIYHGFPDLIYEVDEDSVCMGSHSLVAEMMKLANRVASRIFRDHDVPVVRHALGHPITKTPQGMEEILNAQSSRGYVPEQVVIKNLEVSIASQYCLEPKGHFALGIPKGEGYVHVTSPLRRFEDMVSHWQLHHILLKSASPRFSLNEMEKMVTEQETLSRLNKKIGKQNNHNFLLLYLQRFAAETAKGVERPFGDPLASMDGWIRHRAISSITNRPVFKVQLPLLGIAATVLDGPLSFVNAPLGADLRVKFDKVELGTKRARMLVNIIE